jgi:hypothetical protein
MSAGVLVGIMCVVLACLAAVPRALGVVGHGDASSKGLLHIPSNGTLADCPTHCGDVKISYPFGIGSGPLVASGKASSSPVTTQLIVLLGSS